MLLCAGAREGAINITAPFGFLSVVWIKNPLSFQCFTVRPVQGLRFLCVMIVSKIAKAI